MSFKCKKCGSEKHYFVRTYVRGVWEELRDGDGTVSSTNLDGLIYGNAPRSVTCGECGARNPNPELGMASINSAPTGREEEAHE